MIEIKRWHLIAATAAPLAVMLVAIAVNVSRGPSRSARKPDVSVSDAPNEKSKFRDEDRASKATTTAGAKALAVTADGFDLISTSLDEFGAGCRYEIIDDEALLNSAELRRFEAVFLTCADVEEPAESLPKALRDYVAGGGTLYASDLRYDTLALAFPEVFDPASVAQGVPQDLRAEVTLPELRDLLGPEITLHFKSERWRTAAFRGEDVSILLKGQLKTTAGAEIESPLAVRFPIGRGTVVFTSFHSEGRVNDVEARLLKFLALKAVTSASEVRLTESLADAGFSISAVSAAALHPGTVSKFHDFQHEAPGPLRFSLGPARPGAGLRLEIVDPAGKPTTKRGDSTLVIDLTNAAIGRWQFRAVAERAPYASFPAVLVVATSGGPSDSVSGRMNPTLTRTGGNVLFKKVDLGNQNLVKEARPLRIGVTKPKFDDMGRLLGALGNGYQYTEIEESDIITPLALDPYDVLFLTCNGWPIEWGLPSSGREAQPRCDVRCTETRNYRETQAFAQPVRRTRGHHLRLGPAIRTTHMRLPRASSGNRPQP